MSEAEHGSKAGDQFAAEAGGPAERPRARRLPTASGDGKRVVSIKDVAGAAGVSIATVSRVLNNPSLVAASTAERVQKAVRDLGYRPNLFAKGLMTKKSRLVGVSLPDWQGDSYSDLMRGADDRARSLGYHLLVSTDAHHLGASDRPGAFALDLVDGLIVMVTRSGRQDLDAVTALDKPVVLLGSAIEQSSTDSIEVDNASGARAATEHLLAGTPGDRCYFVGGPDESADADTRCRAFADTLRDGGFEPRPDQLNRGSFSFQWGWDWAGGAIERSELRGAAVFAGNDEIAIGIMHRARQAGLDLPRDLRIVGFDDSRQCGFATPPLSSVRVPNRRIGAEAIAALILRIGEPTTPPRHRTLVTELVVRESSWY